VARELRGYVGTYWEGNGVFKIVVSVEEDEGGLYWAFQGLDSERYRLEPYSDDGEEGATFTWLLPRNDLLHRGRLVDSDQDADYWKARFYRGERGGMMLSWAHDIGVPPLVLERRN
jgi:hypothetical protein